MMYARTLLLVMLVMMAGCGESGEPTGTVTGRVTHKGSPLTEGTISFSSSGDSAVVNSGLIQADGTYALQFGNQSGIPVGEYNVTVHPPAPPFDPANPVPPPRKEYPNIPPRYRDPATSPLEAVVSEGGQERNFDLTP